MPKRYFIIDPDDGRTRAVCDTKPKEFGKFEIKGITIPDKDFNDIKQGKKKAAIKDGKINLEDFNN